MKLIKFNFQGEKYFVLKKPKEAPTVLRKPPRPAKQRDRPVSGPPAFRGAKLEEMPGGSVLSVRQHSGDESPDLSHPNKENNKPVDSRDAKDGRLLSSDGSVDSGVDTDVSLILCQFHVNVLSNYTANYIHTCT